MQALHSGVYLVPHDRLIMSTVIWVQSMQDLACGNKASIAWAAAGWLSARISATLTI
jgi:hypothetical protein